MPAQLDKKEQDRRTVLFVSVLLFGGFLHAVEKLQYPWVTTVVFVVIQILYFGLVYFWGLSVRRRMLPTKSRRYFMIIAGLMVFYLFLRLFKYRIVPHGTVWERYCWYAFYIPLVMVPTLFLMSCISLSRKDAVAISGCWLLCPALVLTLGVLCNDLHHLVFSPKQIEVMLTGETGTYTYGMLFYFVYAWIGLTVLTGVVQLLVSYRGIKDWKRALVPILFLAAIPVLTYLRDRLKMQGVMNLPYEIPEIDIFCMLGCMESMIRSHILKIQREQEERRAKLDAGNRTLNAVTKEVASAQKQIDKRLEGLETDSPDFDRVMGRCCVLFAYIKRKGNFALVDAEAGRIRADELAHALEEMGWYMQYCGITAQMENRANRDFAYREALDLFDSASRLMDALMPGVTKLMACLRDDALLLTADCALLRQLPELPCAVNATEEDGLLYLTIVAEGGGTE